MVLLEPKAVHTELPRFAYELGFGSYFHGGETNKYIWVMWNSEVTVSPFRVFSQAITLNIQFRNQPAFIASFIYASCLARIRLALWEHLSDIATYLRVPWLICGDFNEITSHSEKIGGRFTDDPGMHDFQNFILTNGLMDAGFVVNQFTWSNNRRGTSRIWQRLDRALISHDFLEHFESFTVHHLARLSSDHSPLCLSFQGTQKKIQKSIYFPTHVGGPSQS